MREQLKVSYQTFEPIFYQKESKMWVQPNWFRSCSNTCPQHLILLTIHDNVHIWNKVSEWRNKCLCRMHRNKLVPALKISRLFSTQCSSISEEFLHLLMQSSFCLYEQQIQENESVLPPKIMSHVTQTVFYSLLFYKSAFRSVTWESPQKGFCDYTVRLFVADNRIHTG